MFPVQSGAALSSLSSALLLAAPIAGAPKNPQNDHSKHTSLGLLTYCFGLAQKARAELPDIPDYNDPIAFICEAARFGADAVQIPFGIRDVGSIRAIRNIAEQLGVALESTLGLPQTDSDIAKFETEMQTLRELGVSIVRTVVFPGRRYEDLHSYGAYESALKNAKDRIRRAEPIAKKHDIKLAIENHKDQRIDERVRLFKEFESEYIGACVDVGNNIALLEDPVEVSRALAPWALTAHFKDQGVREYEDGFLLADVPLGQGCIDLPNVVRAVREKRPNIHLQLELITRDALKVPVLNESYWATFPEVKASELSRTWAMIKERASRAPFPEVSRLSAAEKVALERRNIEESFRYAAKNLNF